MPVKSKTVKETSSIDFFVDLERKNLKNRPDCSQYLISICILKGKTTTREQFIRLLDSLKTSILYYDNKEGVGDYNVKYELFFMVDDLESINDLRFFTEEVLTEEDGEPRDTNFFIYCMKRNGDAGDLRNEFIGHLVNLEETAYSHCDTSFFGFMDGDDHVNETFFASLADYPDNPKLIIINPESVYADTGRMDSYPIRWTLNSRNAMEEGRKLSDLALEDIIGGQAWGKYYSYSLLYSGAKFGKGLFEDVPFWYQICSKINSWDDVALVDGSIYYWRRDNSLSLTRIVPDWSSFCNAFDNLEKACEIAINKFGVKASDRRVWKRYTTGILTLMRNAHKFDDEKVKNEYVKKIKARINPEYFRPRELEYLEPKYVETVRKDCPDYDEIVQLDV